MNPFFSSIEIILRASFTTAMFTTVYISYTNGYILVDSRNIIDCIRE